MMMIIIYLDVYFLMHVNTHRRHLFIYVLSLNVTLLLANCGLATLSSLEFRDFM